MPRGEGYEVDNSRHYLIKIHGATRQSLSKVRGWVKGFSRLHLVPSANLLPAVFDGVFPCHFAVKRSLYASLQNLLA